MYYGRLNLYHVNPLLIPADSLSVDVPVTGSGPASSITSVVMSGADFNNFGDNTVYYTVRNAPNIRRFVSSAAYSRSKAFIPNRIRYLIRIDIRQPVAVRSAILLVSKSHGANGSPSPKTEPKSHGLPFLLPVTTLVWYQLSNAPFPSVRLFNVLIYCIRLL